MENIHFWGYLGLVCIVLCTITVFVISALQYATSCATLLVLSFFQYLIIAYRFRAQILPSEGGGVKKEIWLIWVSTVVNVVLIWTTTFNQIWVTVFLTHLVQYKYTITLNNSRNNNVFKIFHTFRGDFILVNVVPCQQWLTRLPRDQFIIEWMLVFVSTE